MAGTVGGPAAGPSPRRPARRRRGRSRRPARRRPAPRATGRRGGTRAAPGSSGDGERRRAASRPIDLARAAAPCPRASTPSARRTAGCRRRPRRPDRGVGIEPARRAADRPGRRRPPRPAARDRSALRAGRSPHSAGARRAGAGPCTARGSARATARRRGARGTRGTSVSAEWMSSMTTTTGRSLASVSSSRRPPQNSSATGERVVDSPMADATRSAIASRRRRRPGDPADLRRAHRRAGRPRSISAASRTISASGQNVIPSPYGRHRREDGRAVADARQELADEPGLADARVADDRDEPGPPSGRRRAKAASRARPSRTRGRRRGDVGRPAVRRLAGPRGRRIGGTGSALPLSSGLDRSTSTPSPDQVVGRLADEDLVGGARSARAGRRR